MRERLIFETDTERAEVRKSLSETFPLGKLWYVPDDTDFLMDAEFPCSEEAFFRYALLAPGPHGQLVFSCLHLTLLMLDPPPWMAAELSKPQRQLPAKS
jgi:hypothetical protein